MIIHFLTEKVSAFLRSRTTNTIERHRVIVYLLHSVLVVTVISLQFMGLGGSQEALPQTMSGIHLAMCLLSLSLYLTRRLTLSKAFSLVALVAQCTIAVRFFYFATVRPDHFLQLILINQITSLLAIFFLVLSFVRLTPLSSLLSVWLATVVWQPIFKSLRFGACSVSSSSCSFSSARWANCCDIM